MQDQDDKRAAFINGLLLAHADGVSDPSERDVLWDFKEAVGLSDAEAVALYGQVRSGRLGLQRITRTGAAMEMLALLARVAAADGVVTAEERAVITEVAALCGLSRYTLAQLTTEIWQAEQPAMGAPDS